MEVPSFLKPILKSKLFRNQIVKWIEESILPTIEPAFAVIMDEQIKVHCLEEGEKEAAIMIYSNNEVPTIGVVFFDENGKAVRIAEAHRAETFVQQLINAGMEKIGLELKK